MREKLKRGQLNRESLLSIISDSWKGRRGFFLLLPHIHLKSFKKRSRMANVPADVAKTLKVKKDGLKRILKDHDYAAKELEREEKRLADFQSDASKVDRVRQQQMVVEESRKMIPEAKSRLTKAAADLQDYLTREGLEEGEDVEQAKAFIVQAQAMN